MSYNTSICKTPSLLHCFKYAVLTIFLSFTANVLCSQTLFKDKRTKVDKTWANYYKDKLNPDFELILAGPIYTLEKGPDYYLYQGYHLDTKVVTERQCFADAECKIRIGKRLMYADNGNKWQEYNYKDGLLDGRSLYYNWETNQLVSASHYKANKKDGVSIHYHSNGNIQSVEHYTLDSLNGERVVYEMDGTEHHREQWVNGQLESTTCTEKADLMSTEPAFPCDPKFSTSENCCSENALLSFLSTNMKYPMFPRKLGVQGKILVFFVVDKTGDVIDVKIPNAMCNAFHEEVMNLMKIMPKWQPGIANGEPVKVRYTIPIMFRLE